MRFANGEVVTVFDFGMTPERRVRQPEAQNVTLAAERDILVVAS